MNTLFTQLGSLFIPFMVVVIVLALLLVMRIISNNYVKVPPNKVAIFYGRKRKTGEGKEIGFKVVAGGSKIKLPLLENVEYLDLNVFTVSLAVKGAPNKDGVMVNVKGVANVKVLSDEASLVLAAERFLGMKPDQIKDIAFQNLEGHLRAIVGRLTVEEIVSDRQKFNQEVLQEAGEDLRKIGLGVDVLTIQEIDDEYKYIESLGKKRTAEVQKDATIGKAEADRDATIKSTTADMEGKKKENENLALIAFAEKEKDVKKAQYEAEVKREQATAAQAGPLAEQEAKKKVVETTIEVENIKTKKETEVAIARAEKREKELLSEVVKPAEAQRQAAIARAEGEKLAAIATAEGEKQRKELEGRGEATAILARGEAEAKVIELKLLAEAKGVLQKAEAYKQLNEAGRLLQILEAAKEIIPIGLEKLAPVMGEIAKPLGNVDRISIVDMGGEGNNGGGLGKFAKITPAVLFQFFESLKAFGLDPSGLQELIKVKPADPGASKENLPELPK
jgi:flotillin